MLLPSQTFVELCSIIICIADSLQCFMLFVLTWKLERAQLLVIWMAGKIPWITYNFKICIELWVTISGMGIIGLINHFESGLWLSESQICNVYGKFPVSGNKTQ